VLAEIPHSVAPPVVISPRARLAIVRWNRSKHCAEQARRRAESFQAAERRDLAEALRLLGIEDRYEFIPAEILRAVLDTRGSWQP
jgi:hypothetical protein